ncbi:MAG TPA: AtzE family amidohydrolase [Steroidobacteraceae bacterium]|nr:AtzE family amidohydrolase [Steroidobacteraceae bacterium]
MTGALLAAHQIASNVRSGRASAEEITGRALSTIAARDGELNCFTTVLADRAIRDARAIDTRIRQGEDPGALAGVPVGVKDLYDVAGVVTLAGSKILAQRPPAACDAVLVSRLKAAGAVLLGCQNMDEFAYGFTTENPHYGPTRNPHDTARSAGGSSGGSAAAVAAGMVAISLGSDTNGSIRVPSSFCGIFGLKPTFGRLPRTGSFPFVHDLDHLGPFARCVRDLALAYDVLQGFDARDAASANRAVEPALPDLERGIDALRVGVLDDWFEYGASAEAQSALARVAAACGSAQTVRLPEARRARAAAFCLTGASAAALHLQHLKSRPHDFGPAVRDRLFAGALLPAMVLAQAQRLRRWFAAAAAQLFQRVDVLLAPATPVVATLLGQETLQLGEEQVPARPNIGLYTQPISFIGLPVVVVPLSTERKLPIGVQIIAPPWREATALRVAAHLERERILSSA